jgi:hypothetical protein
MLLLFVAIAASWWTYRTTVPEIKPLLRLFLGTLRAVSLGLILFLLFEPILQRSVSKDVRPVVAVLIDGSQSMALSDSLLGDSSPQLPDKVRSLQRSLAGLDVRYYSFGSQIQSLDSLQSLQIVEGRTDIASALQSVSEQLSDVPLSSVILVSDGLYNSGTNPIHVAERYEVPIFTVAHGDSTTRKDVRIVQVISNELTYAGSSVPVLVRIRNDGYSSGQLAVRLSDASGVLDQISLPLPAPGTESEVELTYDAATAGRTSLTIGINRFVDEATFRNNTSSLSILVIDQKKKILLLAGAPSPDVSNLVRLISSDETAEITTLIQAPNGSFYSGELPQDFSETDLIVSIGFPGKATPPALSVSVANAVKDGTPLFFILDRQTDLLAVQRDFNDLLPVTLESIRNGFLEGSFFETTSAASHSIFDTGVRSDNARWGRLPPILLNESRWEASPSATVLTSSQIRGIAIGDPVFAVGRSGRTKSAAFLAHGLWKWTNAPEDLEDESAAFNGVLKNTIQWLYASDDNRLVRVQPSETEYGEGESIVLRGEVYDETLRPLSDASLSIQLTDPEGQQFPYEMTSLGNGRYVLDLGSLPAGSYKYLGLAMRNDGEIGTDEGQFSVGTRSLEFRNTKADFALMLQISSRSGGMAVAGTDLETLPVLIRNLPGFQSVSFSTVTQVRLWQKLPFLFMVMVFLTLEWFFRKRFGMV